MFRALIFYGSKSLKINQSNRCAEVYETKAHLKLTQGEEYSGQKPPVCCGRSTGRIPTGMLKSNLPITRKFGETDCQWPRACNNSSKSQCPALPSGKRPHYPSRRLPKLHLSWPCVPDSAARERT